MHPSIFKQLAKKADSLLVYLVGVMGQFLPTFSIPQTVAFGICRYCVAAGKQAFT